MTDTIINFDPPTVGLNVFVDHQYHDQGIDFGFPPYFFRSFRITKPESVPIVGSTSLHIRPEKVI